MDLLRFTTAGSVDDGKSTLIGRLLYDSKAIFDDQYEAIKATSERRGEEGVNLALLTDGLRAEREQGITIDVAYRYFATPRRKFIIADTPGHIQYTRNMVTGASTANLAIILVDARKGVIEQTRRHTIIASLLGIPHIVVCVNKMDLVEYSQAIFDDIRRDFQDFAAGLNTPDTYFLPISALHGDNVVDRSVKMVWYTGPTLLSLLETVEIENDVNHTDGRFPVQYVIRPQSAEYHDYRGYAGRITGGVFRPGDAVQALPSGTTTRVKSVDTFEGAVAEAYAPMSVTLTLEDEIDISRGDMIVAPENPPQVSQDIEMMVCWLGEKSLVPNGKYTLRHTTREVRAIIKSIDYKLDISTLDQYTEDKSRQPERDRADHSPRDSATLLRFLPAQPRDRQCDLDRRGHQCHCGGWNDLMRKPLSPFWQMACLCLLPICLLPLSGCDHDRPISGSPPTPPASAASASQTADAGASSGTVDAGTASAPTPPDESDPLLSGGSRSRYYSDPQLASDPMQGPAMPTLHSHWLKGHLHGAHVTVLLNSARQGTFYGPVDRDITMRLRKGLNSITFIYQPDDANASGQIQVLEGEHDAPIAPLAIFQSPPAANDDKLQPLTQTFRFIAN